MRQRGTTRHSHTSLLWDWGTSQDLRSLSWPRATRRDETPERPTSWSLPPNCVLADRVLKIRHSLSLVFFLFLNISFFVLGDDHMHVIEEPSPPF
jgi:hypothetical protein